METNSCLKIIMNSRKITLSKIYVIYVIIMGLAYKYLEHYEYWNVLLIILSILIIFSMKVYGLNKIKVFQYMMLFLLVLFLIILANSGDNTYIYFNLSRMLPPLLIAVGISLNDSIRRSVLSIISSKHTTIVLNIFYLLNLIIIIVQVFFVHGFLMKKRWLELNSFYPDQCSGLFGNSGTHELCFFTSFITIYNISHYLKNRRTSFLIYILLTTTTSLLVSTQNDNMAMFIVLTLFMLFYLLLIIQWKTKYFSTRVGKILKLVLISLILFAVLWIIPGTKKYILEVCKRLQHFVEAVNMKTTGGYERMAILSYSLKSEWCWKLGKGLGYVEIVERGNKVFGFSHFGLNSTGTFITIGGFWFYLFYCFIFANESVYIYNRKRSAIGSVFIVYIILLFFSFYSPIFSSNPSIIWMFFTWYCYYETKKIIIQGEQSET